MAQSPDLSPFPKKSVLFHDLKTYTWLSLTLLSFSLFPYTS